MELKSQIFAWKSLSSSELKRFCYLAFMLLTIIVVYWLLKSLKDAIFIALVGIHYQPLAKIASLIFIFPFLLVYSKLGDLYPKQKLFYIYSIFYGTLFASISLFLRHPVYGLPGASQSPYNLLGWVSYISIESFGSVMVALFWSFTNGTTSTDVAKKGYPLIIFITQFGAIIGPTLVVYSKSLGIANLYALAPVGTAILFSLVKLYLYQFPDSYHIATHSITKHDSRKKTGVFEGLKCIISEPYVLGILAISTMHEVVGTILDYEMKYVASQVYTSPEDFATFMGRFGQCIHIGSFLFAIFGGSFLLNRYGLLVCLVLFPISTLFISITTSLYPHIEVLFVGMIAFKVLNYALNNPTKEIVYIPTDEDVRFKSKAWIDAFGARLSKGFGSGFIHIFKSSFAQVLTYGCVFSLLVVALWTVAGYYVGSEFEKKKTD